MHAVIGPYERARARTNALTALDGNLWNEAPAAARPSSDASQEEIFISVIAMKMLMIRNGWWSSDEWRSVWFQSELTVHEGWWKRCNQRGWEKKSSWQNENFSADDPDIYTTKAAVRLDGVSQISELNMITVVWNWVLAKRPWGTFQVWLIPAPSFEQKW